MRTIAILGILFALRVAAAAESSTDPDTELAKRHFLAGRTFYAKGDYAAALAEFQRALVAKPLPDFYYNIGRCRENLGQLAEAITAYEYYRATLTAGKEDDDLRAHVAALRTQLATKAPAPTPGAPLVAAPAATAVAAVPTLATPAPAPAAPPKRKRVATWAVGGAGLALLAGSLTAGLIADARWRDLRDRCGPDGVCSPSTVPDAQSLIDSGRSAGIASDVLLGIGIAAVATSVVLFFVEGRRPVERRAWYVQPTPSGIALVTP